MSKDLRLDLQDPQLVELQTEFQPVTNVKRAGKKSSLPPVGVVLSMIFLSAVVVCAFVGGQIAPYNPEAQDLTASLEPSGNGHLLGTDDFGRDVLSRVMAGAGPAVGGAFFIALGAMILGSIFGLLAGYRGGRTDTAVMRVVDITYALPALLVVVVVAGVVGGGLLVTIGLLTILFAPTDTRLIRAATLEQRPRPYVEAAQALGLSDRRIMVRHIWPNVLPVIVANTFLNFAFALVTVAGVAFLGIGIDPNSPEWGRMLYDSRELIFSNAWTALAPALAIGLTALSANLIGDWAFQVISQRGKRG